MKTYIILLSALIFLSTHASTTTSYSLVDLESNKEVQIQNNNDFLLPGSTTKIFTAIYALENLGPSYTFKTKLMYDGDIKEGSLKGNLYLVGGGDPMLLVRELKNFAIELKVLGVKKIEGELIYDDSFLAYQKDVSSLGLIDQTDNPGVSALSCEFNRFRAFNAEDGFLSSPPIKNTSIVLADSKLPDHVELQKTCNDKDIWMISDRIKNKSIIDVPVKHPSYFTAHFFKLILSQEGISINKAAKGIAPNEAKLIATHSSRPLIELVDMNLEYSNNLMSELILLSTVKSSTGKKVSLKEAGTIMKDWFVKYMNDKEYSKMDIYNGSGLDIRNRISPKLFTKLLDKVENKKFGDTFFRSILSISGSKGWLYRRLNQPPFAYKVWAKTGSLDYASSIAGYLYTKSNKRYAFAITSTDQTLREKTTKAKGKVKKELMDSAKEWKKDAIKEQDQILKNWILNL